MAFTYLGFLSLSLAIFLNFQWGSLGVTCWRWLFWGQVCKWGQLGAVMQYTLCCARLFSEKMAAIIFPILWILLEACHSPMERWSTVLLPLNLFPQIKCGGSGSLGLWRLLEKPVQLPPGSLYKFTLWMQPLRRGEAHAAHSKVHLETTRRPQPWQLSADTGTNYPAVEWAIGRGVPSASTEDVTGQ